MLLNDSLKQNLWWCLLNNKYMLTSTDIYSPSQWCDSKDTIFRILGNNQMSRDMQKGGLMYMWTMKVLGILHKCRVSPEPLLFTHWIHWPSRDHWQRREDTGPMTVRAWEFVFKITKPSISLHWPWSKLVRSSQNDLWSLLDKAI